MKVAVQMMLCALALAACNKEPRSAEFCGRTYTDKMAYPVPHCDEPHPDLAKVRKLPGVRELWLTHTEHRDLDALRGADLVRLTLHKTEVEDISVVASMANLRTLRISYSPVSALPPLTKLHELEEVELFEVPVSDVSGLAGATGLRRLNIHQLGIPKEQRLSDLRPLAGMRELIWLNLNRTAVTDLAPLATLPVLRSLDIHSDVEVDLSPLFEMTGLRRLCASGAVDDEQLRELERANPKLDTDCSSFDPWSIPGAEP
jgi:Leucine-rich repeat (LRR) protein